MGLTSKQQLFLSEYLIDMNATQAAIKAGYSEASAYSQGQRLLKNVEIQAAIAQKLQDSAMKSDEILQKLTEIARGSIGDYLDVSSMAFQIDLAKAKELGKLHLIKRVRQKTTTIVREGAEDVEQNQIDIELLDQLKALELLGRYHKLFIDRTELTGKDGVPLVDPSQIDKVLRKVYGKEK